jgi:ornithine decarboxylase
MEGVIAPLHIAEFKSLNHPNDPYRDSRDELGSSSPPLSPSPSGSLTPVNEYPHSASASPSIRYDSALSSSLTFEPNAASYADTFSSPAEDVDHSTTLNVKIARFIQETQPTTPCLIIDVDMVERAYNALRRTLPLTHVFYAVKANPSVPMMQRLVALGSNFDCASPNEIKLCLDLGVSPDRISFGNTIKKQRDIASAYAQGVRLYAFDSEPELQKLAVSAPGARVFCRILVDCPGAEWPLSRKFGCHPDMAVELLDKAAQLGLEPFGLSFHVGSQQTNLSSWDKAVGQARKVFSQLEERGVHLKMLNLGGGFPAHYRAHVEPLEVYADAVMSAMHKHFSHELPMMIIEPGRSMVGDAGVIHSEVVLISRKSADDEKRWVYLDVGKFNGLAETMDESIKYKILTPHDGKPAGPVVLAGPTCDSADILYEKTSYAMPVDLQIGDTVQVLSTGAYTSTYAAVCFNGFAPIPTHCV